ncbi:MAG TPA: bacillithiol system redox-active protein YtxJ [Pyrinomonadaceae bacterium]|nr:bacillithiol system redox-active protein YtxJ [Pyrinomonadaceae bacterium]
MKMRANFINVDSVDGLNRLFEMSFEEPVVLLKHSTTCSISSGVYREVARVPADVNVIVMQTHRDLSNAIENRTGIRHESPQAFVLRDGKAIYHASHFDIEAGHIEANLAVPDGRS